MAARKRKQGSGSQGGLAIKSSSSKGNDGALKEKQKDELDKNVAEKIRKDLVADHLPPMPLVLTILLCSGFMWVYGFRDMMATGRPIGGSMDEAYLAFTKSTHWFDDSKGWKSTGGGLSAVKSATTDANKMGDFFVRKLAGAGAMGVQTQKLLPFLFHPADARWGLGHYVPVLTGAVLGNAAIAAFYFFYLEDFEAAGAGDLPTLFVAVSLLEAVVMAYYALTAALRPRRTTTTAERGRGGSTKKSPHAVTSRIVMRTVSIVSGLTTLVAGRDLLFPGRILWFVPSDDIYLEWTGAFVHSPPDGSPEQRDHGMESPLFAADKIVSQSAALYLLINCLHKYGTAFFVRYGHHGSGTTKCRIVWKGQVLAGCLVMIVFRVFSGAAKSASLDVRWHLMCISYETFILGLYAFF